MLTISRETQRRFILGKQGLYPARRWRGKAGVVQAVRAGCVIQVDPLNVIARSHDIALYGRVLDYQPALLDSALYQDRALFDYGGAVMIHPMEELPYWRVVMGRKGQEPRWRKLADEAPQVVDEVLAAIQARGPLGARDLDGPRRTESSFRSGKLSGQVLYMLWLSGALMTHGRQGFERVYDLTGRVAPAAYQRVATPDEADDFFMRKVFDEVNLVTARSWRRWYASLIERKVEPGEAAARLDALRQSGAVIPVELAHDPKEPRFLWAEDLPLLEAVQRGVIPEAWLPAEEAPSDEMTFLAPLEIVSTRGRALPLFDFEYLWEVYKPAEKRRWGYYTLPILYRDRLVARMDPKLVRATGTLEVRGFWLEDHAVPDESFAAALAAGLRRFMQFCGATSLDLQALRPAALRQSLVERLV